MEGLKLPDLRSRLSTLWIFATLNYLYCDVVTLMDPDMLRKFLSGNMGTVTITQGFLMGAAVLIEIPMAMVLLSRLLGYRPNRLANIVAGVVMTAVQALTLVVKTPAPYYLFFSVIEIVTTVVVVWSAWRWAEVPTASRPAWTPVAALASGRGSTAPPPPARPI
jgi:hypothetical protein